MLKRDSELTGTLLGCIGLAALMVVLIVVGSIINAYVLARLWAWFMVPTFGLHPLTLYQAYGLSVVVGWFIYQEVKTTDKKWNQIIAELLGLLFIRPAITLAVAYLVYITWG